MVFNKSVVVLSVFRSGLAAVFCCVVGVSWRRKQECVRVAGQIGPRRQRCRE